MTSEKRKTFPLSPFPFRGFTLIEILVVIAVIGILIALSAVAYQAIRKSSRDTKRRADLQDIRSALELYRTDCRAYPPSLGSSLVGSGAFCGGNTYMQQVPADPIPSSYSYQYRLVGLGYNLCAYLENGSVSVDCNGDSSANDFCGNSLCNFMVSSP